MVARLLYAPNVLHARASIPLMNRIGGSFPGDRRCWVSQPVGILVLVLSSLLPCFLYLAGCDSWAIVIAGTAAAVGLTALATIALRRVCRSQHPACVSVRSGLQRGWQSAYGVCVCPRVRWIMRSALAAMLAVFLFSYLWSFDFTIGYGKKGVSLFAVRGITYCNITFDYPRGFPGAPPSGVPRVSARRAPTELGYPAHHGLIPSFKCGGRLWHIRLPLIPLLAFLGVAVVLGSLPSLNRAHLARRQRCTECAYDLTGNISGVCPECGRDIWPPRRI